jgi:hypothetical protein
MTGRYRRQHLSLQLFDLLHALLQVRSSDVS